MSDKNYYVYILTNKYNKVLYTGVTNDLIRRMTEHKDFKKELSFTNKYNLDKLIYYEVYNDINLAINREKQIKAGSRNKKVELINNKNKEWVDLSQELFL